MQFYQDFDYDRKWLKLKELLQNDTTNDFERVLQMMNEIETDEKVILNKIEFSLKEESFPFYDCLINDEEYQHLSKSGLTRDEAIAYYHELCKQFNFKKVIMD